METNTRKERKIENLVDLIVRLALEENGEEIKTAVTHKFPDDDAWLCFYIGKKFVKKMADAKLVFVNAGETLPGSENDPSVKHFDTGKGPNDQHGKRLKRTCSAALVAKELGVLDDPGLQPLLEMATAVDNIEPWSTTNLHFLIEGWPRKFNNGTIDWEKVQERVFEAFDIIYGQETQRVQSRQDLNKYAERTTLANGLKVVSILWHPELREAAFEEGAAVVIWTQTRGKKGFYTGIALNRKYRDQGLYLNGVAAALRLAEAKTRGINVQGQNLYYIDRKEPVTTWYLHDSQALILNGSQKWTLKEEEYTKLAPRQIVGLVHRALSAIPREKVSQWNSK